MMGTHIKKALFDSILMLRRHIILNQLADNTTLFLKDKEQSNKAIQCLNEFNIVSGLRINKNKSVVFPLKDCTLREVCGIPIKDTVTYLGIVVCKDPSLRNESNFNPINNIKKDLMPG